MPLVKVSSTKDTQRAKLYKWEDTHLNNNEEANKRIIFEECVEFISYVCKEYNINSPIILPGTNKNKSAEAYRSRVDGKWYITLPPWARTKLTCLHEVCHIIIFQNKPGIHFPAHSSVFLKLYIDLLIRFLNYNPVEIRRSVMSSKLKVAYDISSLLFI